MSPAVRRLPSPLLASLLALVVPVGLACSGLPPLPGAISGAGGEDGARDPEPGDGEPEPEPVVASPESLFTDLDAAEAPPWERTSVKCPPGTMVIRYPKGNTLSVYCATGSGVRSGPYTEWQRNTLLVAATNVNGKLDGPWTRWEKAGDTPRKVEQQTYVAGVATGDHAEWDLEGRLLVRGRRVDGRKHGRFVERTVADDAIVPGGACYADGTEVWRTSSDTELVQKSCGSEPVAEAPADGEAPLVEGQASR